MEKTKTSLQKENAVRLTAYIDKHEESTAAFHKRLKAVDINGKKQTLAVHTVSQWRNGVRHIPPVWMPSLEKESGGILSRKKLHKGWRSLWPEIAND